MTNIQENVARIKQKITDYEKKYGRKTGCVSLLAVSKGQSLEKMTAAWQIGQRQFGENHVQEALSKIEAFADKDIEWHFIGKIQSNKTRKIAEHFAWVHSIEDMKIAKRLNDQRPPHLPPLNICIEINISNEATKSGIKPEEALPLAQYCLTLPRLALRGLMTVPAAHQTVEEQHRAFHHLFSLSQSLREQSIALDTLSMGMSGDFESAIAEGTTIVRIGTALFGPREKL